MYATYDSSSYEIPIEGDSKVFRYTEDGQNPSSLVDLSSENINTVWDLLLRRSSKDEDAEFLGVRHTHTQLNEDTGVEKASLGPYYFFTNKAVESKVRALGSALILKNGGIVKEVNFPTEKYQQKFKMVGIWSKNRLEWAITDFACSAYGLVSVTIYDTLGLEATHHILKITKMSVICTEEKHIEDIVKIAKELKTLDTIISFDKLTEEHIKIAKESNITLYYFDDLINEFSVNEKLLKPKPGKTDDVAMIVFTSGTTGVPKGAMHTNLSILAPVAGYIKTGNRMGISHDDVILSYLPLAHVYEHAVFLTVMYFHCKIGFYHGDMLRLVDDLQELKPTVIIGVPRVFHKMHDKIMDEVRKKGVILGKLFEMAIRTKIFYYEKTGNVNFWPLDKLIFSKPKNAFGGKIRVVSLGGAAMDVDILKQLSVILSIHFCEGWGMTELGIAFVQHKDDVVKGTIGGPYRSVEYKLRSLPDMNYSISNEIPSGELLVRGPCVMKGYFQAPELTNEAFVENGWLKTGDVVEQYPNGALKIIDRSKNMFKLQQGEFVSPELVQDIYRRAKFVKEIFVYGESNQTCLVAVVVPDENEVKNWAIKHNKDSKTYDDLVKFDEELKNEILTQMNKVAENKLLGFEKVKGIHLTTEPFNIDNNSLTPTYKIVRKTLTDMYKNVLQTVYNNISHK